MSTSSCEWWRTRASYVVISSGASGNLVHDAHIAALCLEHDVSEIITGDRDFARFPGLSVHNPFEV